MNKNIAVTYQSMNQDISQSKFSNEFYYEGKNIRVLSTDSQSSNSLTNEKGNTLLITIPSLSINYDDKTISYNNIVLNYNTEQINEQFDNTQSGSQILIGHAIGKNNIILFTTDDNGFDCIWSVDKSNFAIKLLYIRNLNFSINNPIQTVINYENSRIEKVYFVDGKNQMRFLNIKQSILNGDNEELIDIESSLLNVVGDFKFAQPELVSKEQGGTHTAGMIQYGYTLYRLNGASTKLSPLSELISLDNGEEGGGKINEVVNNYPVIKIPVIDRDYSNLRLYSIKYTSYNELPEVNLILDRNVSNMDSLTYYDTGTIISPVSLDEITFIGNNMIYIPKHINTKFNRLFSANFEEKSFDIKLDTRSYSFPKNSTSTSVYDSLTYESVTDTMVGNAPITIDDSTYDDVPMTHNSLNKDFDTYSYKHNSDIFGGTGKFISWELVRSQVGINFDNISKTESLGKFLKDREIYRFGIQFYNKKSQISLPKWIADFKVNVNSNYNNINGYYASLKISLNSEFFVWLNDSSNFLDDDGKYDDNLKPIGFKLLRAERTLKDRSVVCQGLLNGSYVIRNTATDNFEDVIPELNRSDREIYNNHPKMPSLMRPYDGSVSPLRGMLNYGRVDTNEIPHPSQGGGTPNPWGPDFYGNPRNNGRAEIYGGVARTSKRSMVFQFNQLMQMYSPEITFNQVQKLDNTKLDVIGGIVNDFNAGWYKIYNENTKEVRSEVKINGAITPYSSSFSVVFPDGYDPTNPPPAPTEQEYRDYIDALILAHNELYGVNADQFPLYLPTFDEYKDSQTSVNSDIEGTGLNVISGKVQDINKWGLIGLNPVYQVQLYRRYNGLYKYSDNSIKYEIFGNPLIVDTGAGRTVYNKDNSLAFYNTFSIMNTDTGEGSDGDPNFRVQELNSWGSRCILMSLGDSTTETIDRPPLDTIFRELSGLTFNASTDIVPDNGANLGLIGELVLNKSSIYAGVIYGGNDYESRKRTNYIEIGKYRNLVPNVFGELTYNCVNAGDTFINSFKFTKIVKTNTEIYKREIPQYTELVEVRMETTVDLKNRSDYSIEDWDNRFQPRYEEYQNYNRVYSQEPNFFIRKDVDYNFKSVSKFENGIIASKVKIPGEVIDSWLSYLQNEVMYIDGKYGSINSLHSFKDELYTLQDSAIARISIAPRVQVQGNDGVEIQLGTGQVLDSYQYLTTMSGTLNKWSIVNSPNAFYYYDTLNKSINVATQELSDLKGMHSFLINNTSEQLKIDNPLLKKGVVSSYDYLNNEILFTFLQENNSFTLAYNELKQSFTSFYDYTPSIYISSGDLLLSTHPNLKSLYKHFTGDYGVFYDKVYPSYIIFNLNPEPHFDCVFDNINYKSEVYSNNIDEPNKTLTAIQAYNDYQSTFLTPLINSRNGNLRRRFRDWNAEIPRDGRNRIRGPWIKLKVQFDNNNNYKLILHDMIISYTV